jgi:putative membrane protein
MTADDSGANVRHTADHFAWIRTRLALEQTLMSWVRTATTLIGFGFAIVEFFDHLSATGGIGPARYPQMSRFLGLALVGAGVLGLLVALQQYGTVSRYLRQNFSDLAGMGGLPRVNPMQVVSILLLGIGLLVFVAILSRAV